MTKQMVLPILIVIFLFSSAFPAKADETENLPKWSQQWIDWAKNTENPKFIHWAERYHTPESIRAGMAWESFLGYNAVDIVANDTKAPGIKPGLVITPENVGLYEQELRELFPYGFDWQVDRITGKGVFANYNVAPLEMVIVPTHHAWNDPAYLDATIKYNNVETCSIDNRGNLQGWVAGIPFPFPKNGMEVVHSYDRLTIMADSLSFLPLELKLLDRSGRHEKTETVELHWKNYVGRIRVDPFPVVPGFEEIQEKGSVVALHPYDMKGFAAVRTRYADNTREDDFIAYLPSMRRIRRLAGSNTQDPFAGSDLTWEDWKGFWTKTSMNPYTAEILGEDVVLCPSFNPDSSKYFKAYGGFTQSSWWERRPVWIVEITHRDTNYIYSKRRWYVDKGTFALQMQIWYDREGRMWKLLDWAWGGNPFVADIINRHITIANHTSVHNTPNLSENLFNLRFLSSKAH